MPTFDVSADIVFIFPKGHILYITFSFPQDKKSLNGIIVCNCAF